MKTRQLYIEKYKKPYPASKEPKLGSNGLLSPEFETKRVEMSARGIVEVDGVEMEFIDLRVYIVKKQERI